MEKQLINITSWNEYEVRIELNGNGHYIPKDRITDFIKANALEIGLEVVRNNDNILRGA